MKKIVLLAFVLVLLSTAMLGTTLVTTVSGSTTHHVYPGESIQVAVNSAYPGDTIFVHAGTYYEEVTIDKNDLTLLGENKTTTIVDGNGTGAIVYVNGANNVNIENFTIQNGYEGVIFMNGNNNTLRNNIITSQGNGVHLIFSSNNTLSGNLISNSGHGIDLDGSERNVLRHNNLVDNEYNFEVSGGYIQDIDNSNTVNGKTVYYWISQNNKHVPPDAGYVALVNSWNITIENLNLTENGQGLLLAHMMYSTIKNVTVSGNKIGIHFVNSHYNTITNSIILNNTCEGVGSSIEQMGLQAAILFCDSHSNIINSSLITVNKGCGIKQSYSNDNSILNCTISKNGRWGINFGYSANCIVSGNLISENGDGILLGHSTVSNGIITDNVVTFNRGHGIYLHNSAFAKLTRNNMTGNRYNFGVGFGAYPVEPINNVDTSNIVNGKPVYYWVKQHDREVPADAGYIAIIESENITVRNLSLSENWQGIFFSKTNNSIIQEINVTNNQIGIYLSSSSDNDISKCTASNNYHGIVVSGSHNKFYQNTVTSNSYYGFYFGGRASTNNTVSCNTISLNRFGVGLYYSSNNTFYHNNFIDNQEQVEYRGYPTPSNAWDDGYPSGGNYWSNYNGTDLFSGPYHNTTGSDGIGDTAYVIDGDNTDNYPLMGLFSDFDATSEHNVQTVCNSSISDFHFNGTAISFNVSGENGTTGFCRIRIPTALMNDTYRVFINSTEVSYILFSCSNGTHSYLYFTYNHSTQEVIIIPEFPTGASMLVILVILTVAVVIYKRRLFKTPIH
jgi:parallel beta-helix repeat protein